MAPPSTPPAEQNPENPYAILPWDFIPDAKAEEDEPIDPRSVTPWANLPTDVSPIVFNTDEWHNEPIQILDLRPNPSANQSWMEVRYPFILFSDFVDLKYSREVNLRRPYEIAHQARIVPLELPASLKDFYGLKQAIQSYAISLTRSLGLEDIYINVEATSAVSNSEVMRNQTNVAVGLDTNGRTLHVFTADLMDQAQELMRLHNLNLAESNKSILNSVDQALEIVAAPQEARLVLLDLKETYVAQSANERLTLRKALEWVIRREVASKLTYLDQTLGSADQYIVEMLRARGVVFPSDQSTPQQIKEFRLEYHNARKAYFADPANHWSATASDVRSQVFYEQYLQQMNLKNNKHFQEQVRSWPEPYRRYFLDQMNQTAELRVKEAAQVKKLVINPDAESYKYTFNNGSEQNYRTIPAEYNKDLVSALAQEDSWAKAVYELPNSPHFRATVNGTGIALSPLCLFDAAFAYQIWNDPTETSFDRFLAVSGAGSAMLSSGAFIGSYLVPLLSGKSPTQVLYAFGAPVSAANTFGSGALFLYGTKSAYDDVVRDYEVTEFGEKAASTGEMFGGGGALVGSFLLLIGSDGLAAPVLLLGGTGTYFASSTAHAEFEENRVASQVYQAILESDGETLRKLCEDERGEFDDDAVVDLFYDYFLNNDSADFLHPTLWSSPFMQPLRAKALKELGGEGWFSYMGDEEAAFRLFIAIHEPESENEQDDVAIEVASQMDSSDWDEFDEFVKTYVPNLVIPGRVERYRK